MQTSEEPDVIVVEDTTRALQDLAAYYLAMLPLQHKIEMWIRDRFMGTTYNSIDEKNRMIVPSKLRAGLGARCVPVSYTHLDVYKRQIQWKFPPSLHVRNTII